MDMSESSGQNKFDAEMGEEGVVERVEGLPDPTTYITKGGRPIPAGEVDDKPPPAS